MKAPVRFHSLDTVRGVAALSVVLFHWRMWNVRPDWTEASFAPDLLPAGKALGFFYAAGYQAVGLFFCLSGFVFYWLYRDAIKSRRVGGWQFAVGRLARLYPLHLATLLFVVGVQWLFGLLLPGGCFEFSGNTPASFFKHLFLFPLVFGRRNFSFNAPDWTLAIEACLYVVFFVASRLVALRFIATAALVAIGAFVASSMPDLGYGISAFFMGGIAYLLFERADSPLVDGALRVVLGVSWFCAFVVGSGIVNIWQTRLYWLHGGGFGIYVLFPCTVLYLAIREARGEGLARRFSRLGDLSYSSYLWHFPVMAACGLALRVSGRGYGLMLAPMGLLLFFSILVPLAIASHRCIERPAQAWLGSRLLTRRGRGQTAPPRDLAAAAQA